MCRDVDEILYGDQKIRSVLDIARVLEVVGHDTKCLVTRTNSAKNLRG
jgi:hypothetical protein